MIYSQSITVTQVTKTGNINTDLAVSSGCTKVKATVCFCVHVKIKAYGLTECNFGHFYTDATPK